MPRVFSPLTTCILLGAALAAGGCGSKKSAPLPTAGRGTAGGSALPPGEPAAGHGWAVEVVPARGEPAYAVTRVASFAAADPASFRATYEASLSPAEPGKYRLGARVDGGSAALTMLGSGLKGDPVTSHPLRAAANSTAWGPWVQLTDKSTFVRISFDAAGGSPPGLRLMWERAADRVGPAFGPEPIPASVLTPAGVNKSRAAAGAAADRGRALLGSLGCVMCHAADQSLTPFVASGPNLAGVGERIDPAWMRKWIVDPHSMRPDATMPAAVVGAADAQREADAIVAFLCSSGGAFERDAVASEPFVIDAGRDLYRTLGCVACHGADDPPASLGDLDAKWRAGSLASFLRDPLATHPGGLMPSSKLTEEEADAIATYLLRATSKGKEHASFAVDVSLVADGRSAFVARGCIACHDGTGATGPIAPVAPALESLDADKGCLSGADDRTPRFVLSDSERFDLAAAIRDATRPGRLGPVDDRVSIRMETLGCVRCHQWHGEGGVASQGDAIADCFTTLEEAELGDEGRLPPRLTGVGGKLNVHWLEQVVTEGGRARPYMAARMPVFAEAATHGFAEALARHDGVRPDQPAREVEPTDALVQAGRRLAGADGLNCISCHVFGDHPPAGTPGPDMAAFAERIRYEWWKSYVMAPSRAKPGTRMPNFYETGHGTVTSVLDGNPDRQTDALWAYFTLADFAPPPVGLPSEGGLELDVGDRPVVFRTFLDTVGSRAIAVGTPAGVHYAFDAGDVRLAEAWQGSFIDASGAWAGRGGTPANGRGPTAWRAPPGPPLLLGERPPTPGQVARPGRDGGYRYLGYRIDSGGHPSFMYELAGDGWKVTVTEHIRPLAAGPVLLAREFSLSGVPAETPVWVNIGSGTLRGVESTADGPATSRAAWVMIPARHFADGTGTFSVEAPR